MRKESSNNSIRVLCIDHEGGHGGSSRSLAELLRGIAQNHEVHVTIWHKAKTDIYQSTDLKVFASKRVSSIYTISTLHLFSRNIASVIYFLFGMITDLPKVKELARIAHEEFDLIHFNHPNMWAFALFLRLFGKKPYTFHIRVGLVNLNEMPRESKLAFAINRATSRFFASLQTKVINYLSEQLFFVSEWDREQFLSLCPKASGLVVYNCIGRAGTKQKHHKRKRNRKKWQLASVENYRWSRGTDRLLSLAKYFRCVGFTEIKFNVAGDMSIPKDVASIYAPNDFNSDTTLSIISQKLGVEDYFVFHGHVSDPERVIAASDILLSLTRRAGPWGRSVIEAMSMGKPVLACGEDKGFVRDSRNGLFFNKFDTQLIGDSIIQLLGDPSRLEKMSSEAARFAKINFSSQKAASVVANQWMDIIQMHRVTR